MLRDFVHAFAGQVGAVAPPVQIADSPNGMPVGSAGETVVASLVGPRPVRTGADGNQHARRIVVGVVCASVFVADFRLEADKEAANLADFGEFSLHGVAVVIGILPTPPPRRMAQSKD